MKKIKIEKLKYPLAKIISIYLAVQFLICLLTH